MTYTIDAHSHIYPPSYMEMLKSRRTIPRIAERDGGLYFVIFPEEEKTGGRKMEPRMWSVDEKLGFMDEGGFARSVVSLGNPWLDQVIGAESVDWAHRINTDLSGLEAASGGRMHALGVLPNHTPEAVAEVVRSIAADPKLHGVITGTRIAGRRFDDPELAPVWSELSATRLPVFVHPHYAVAVDELDGYGTVLPLGIGFPVETSIAAARFVLSGGFQAYPGVEMLLAHSGGVLPFLAGRLDVTWRGDPIAQKRLSVPPSEELAKLWVDAVAYHPRAIRTAIDLVGPERMIFGTDHPFFKEAPKDIFAPVEAVLADDERGKLAVASGNAIRLFGLDK
jgi:aminocarboxymuconate-semialdehyde decarboxylase